MPPAPFTPPHLPPTAAVNDLFKLTDDPKVQKRLLSADTDHDGRISRRDVLNVLKSEVAGGCCGRCCVCGGGVDGRGCTLVK